MAVKVAINGFGRIGRLAFRNMHNDSDFEIVAINDLTSTSTLAHLLKYDSAQGRFDGEVSSTEGAIIVNGKEIKIYSERDPQDLPWGELDIDVVIESTGFFCDKESASKHLTAGAKKVIISAPAKGDMKTVVFNVNHTDLDGSEDIISAASCTTNCLAPLAQVLDAKFGIKQGLMNTIHAYTNDQVTLDGPHSDLRRARTAAQNIVPTSTGAAVAVGLVLPNMAGKLDGGATRVPVQTGSMVDLTLILDKETSVEEINATVKAAANETLGYTEDEIVSSDVIGIHYGSLFDAKLTKVQTVGDQQLVNVTTWYDNEMSYVAQFVRTAKYVASFIK